MNANKATAFELLDFLHPLINLATIQEFIYCFLDFELQHSPLAKFICYVYASLKTPPKNLVGKRVGEKSTSQALFMLHLLKTHQGKKSTTVDIGSVLRDRHVIFWITIMGCGFQG